MKREERELSRETTAITPSNAPKLAHSVFHSLAQQLSLRAYTCAVYFVQCKKALFCSTDDVQLTSCFVVPAYRIYDTSE
eukprot:COSAG02_NODE_2366_length_9052_cov_1.784541_2_plen_79_part_00